MVAKVSVIVPVYNVERFLQDCIDSLVNQTLEEMELIFVNDASPDNSLAILYENQKKHPDKIVVIDSKVNMRQGGARNLGLAKATAEYVAFVDSDDFVGPDMYRTLYEKAQQTNADAVFMSAVSVTENTKYSKELCASSQDHFRICFHADRCKRFEGVELDRKLKEEFLVWPDSPSVWSGIYKKSLLLENNIRFPEHLKFEDNYWCSVLRCYLSRVAIADGIGYHYRFNENSTVHKRNTADFFDRRTVENMLLETAKERNLWDDLHEAWEYLYANRYGINTFLTYVTRYDDIPYDKIKALQAEVNEKFPRWDRNRYLLANKSLKQKIRVFVFKQNADSILGRLVIKAIAAYFNR